MVAQLRDKMAPASVVKVHGVLRVALTDALRVTAWRHSSYWR
ncbi:hypothetical protein [Catellatospora paridis]|nr:hypothetical protein [Catellatospora paridis]